jgi:hypothetical protein
MTSANGFFRKKKNPDSELEALRDPGGSELALIDPLRSATTVARSDRSGHVKIKLASLPFGFRAHKEVGRRAIDPLQLAVLNNPINSNGSHRGLSVGRAGPRLSPRPTGGNLSGGSRGKAESPGRATSSLPDAAFSRHPAHTFAASRPIPASKHHMYQKVMQFELDIRGIPNQHLWGPFPRFGPGTEDPLNSPISLFVLGPDAKANDLAFEFLRKSTQPPEGEEEWTPRRKVRAPVKPDARRRSPGVLWMDAFGQVANVLFVVQSQDVSHADVVEENLFDAKTSDCIVVPLREEMSTSSFAHYLEVVLSRVLEETTASGVPVFFLTLGRDPREARKKKKDKTKAKGAGRGKGEGGGKGDGASPPLAPGDVARLVARWPNAHAVPSTATFGARDPSLPADVFRAVLNHRADRKMCLCRRCLRTYDAIKADDVRILCQLAVEPPEPFGDTHDNEVFFRMFTTKGQAARRSQILSPSVLFATTNGLRDPRPAETSERDVETSPPSAIPGAGPSEAHLPSKGPRSHGSLDALGLSADGEPIDLSEGSERAAEGHRDDVFSGAVVYHGNTYYWGNEEEEEEEEEDGTPRASDRANAGENLAIQETETSCFQYVLDWLFGCAGGAE